MLQLLSFGDSCEAAPFFDLQIGVNIKFHVSGDVLQLMSQENESFKGGVNPR